MISSTSSRPSCATRDPSLPRNPALKRKLVKPLKSLHLCGRHQWSGRISRNSKRHPFSSMPKSKRGEMLQEPAGDWCPEVKPKETTRGKKQQTHPEKDRPAILCRAHNCLKAHSSPVLSRETFRNSSRQRSNPLLTAERILRTD